MKRLVVVLLLAACGGTSKKTEMDMSAVAGDMAMPTSADGGPLDTTPGPGKTLACDSSGENAYDTYGATKLVAINEAIFANVRTELSNNGATNLGSSLQLVPDMGTSTVDSNAVFRAKLGAFLVWAYGGPSSFQYIDGVTYDGVQNMTTAHAGLAITQAQYDYFLMYIVIPALESNGIVNGAGDADNDIVSCFAPVLTDPTFEASIIGQ